MRRPHTEAFAFVQRIDQDQRANPRSLRRTLDHPHDLFGRTIACIEQIGRLDPGRCVGREGLPHQQYCWATLTKTAVGDIAQKMGLAGARLSTDDHHRLTAPALRLHEILPDPA